MDTAIVFWALAWVFMTVTAVVLMVQKYKWMRAYYVLKDGIVMRPGPYSKDKGYWDEVLAMGTREHS